MDPVAGLIVAGGAVVAAALAWSAGRMSGRTPPKPPPAVHGIEAPRGKRIVGVTSDGGVRYVDVPADELDQQATWVDIPKRRRWTR